MRYTPSVPAEPFQHRRGNGHRILVAVNDQNVKSMFSLVARSAGPALKSENYVLIFFSNG